MFAAKLYFPSDYPLNPFKMVFDPPLLHPNSTFIPPFASMGSVAFALVALPAAARCMNTAANIPVYPNGNVCISILHPPGDDPLRYESANERWSPVQGVRSVLLSVLSMLAEPNIESGADIECCKLYRENKPEFERRVREQVRSLLGL